MCFKCCYGRFIKYILFLLFFCLVDNNLNNNEMDQINKTFVENEELNQNSSVDANNVFDIVDDNNLIDDNTNFVEDIFEDALPFIDNLNENNDDGLTEK